jgi:O-antigen/teichoic acid export membrane protein
MNRSAGLTARIAALPAPVIYATSVLTERAVSFITIPLMAAFLTPAEFGQLDLAVTMLEFWGIVMALGLADTIVRFSGTTADPGERRERTAELVGTALPIALAIGFVAQLALPQSAELWKLQMPEAAIRLALVAAMLSGFIEMPMAWMRLQDRSLAFAGVSLARMLIQLLLMYLTLSSGFGASGWLAASSLLSITVSVLLTGHLVRETGIRFSHAMLRRIVAYALPLVGAGLAAYALANLSRLFLAQSVSTAEIAHFTVAARLASAAPLLLYPFMLWWGPHRLAALGQDGGLVRSAEMWGIGFSIMVISAAAVALLAPIFVELALPVSYRPSIRYIAPLAMAMALGQIAWLSSVGCYARSHGLFVLGIEWTAAIVTLSAYYIVVPAWGVAGAVLVMLFGQGLRFILLLAAGEASAPIPYPLAGALVSAAAAIGFVLLAPGHVDWWLRIGWTAVSVACIGATLVLTGVLDGALWWRFLAALGGRRPRRSP